MVGHLWFDKDGNPVDDGVSAGALLTCMKVAFTAERAAARGAGICRGKNRETPLVGLRIGAARR
jgi:hypothetical protein